MAEDKRTMKKNKYRHPKLKLKVNYEYVNISRYTEGGPDDFGVPGKTWSTIYTNVRADLQPVSLQSGQTLSMFQLGLVQQSSDIGFFEPDTDIRVRDKIIDDDGNEWEVLEVTSWQKHHKQALLKTWEEKPES